MWYNIQSEEYSKNFLKHLNKYPELKKHVKRVIKEIETEPDHPHQHERLHTKNKLFSARVNKSFRIIYEIKNNKIYFLEIGPHKLYQKF